LKALNQLVTATRPNPRLDEGHQINFLERIETPDFPPDVLHFYEGDPCTLFRNMSTLAGLVKGRRCWVIDAKERFVVIQFESGEQLSRLRIPMEKVSNGMQFWREQIRLKLLYAEIVHRSQGMRLNRAVIDFRRYFWEHIQISVGLSRVRYPANLDILLPESCQEILSSDPGAVPLRIPVDREVVNVVSTVAGHSIEAVR
jgi:hypothetical protein